MEKGEDGSRVSLADDPNDVAAYDCNIEADMQGVSGRGEGVCR